MAESLLTQQPTGTPSISRLQEFTNQTGNTNYENMLKRAQEVIDRPVYGADTAVSRLQSAVSGIGVNAPTGRQRAGAEIARSQGNQMVRDLQQSVIPATQGQKKVSDVAVAQKTESSIESMKRLDAFGEDVTLRAEQAHQSWERAAAGAEDVIATADYEVARSMKDVTDIGNAIGKDLDFSKAHDMQVAAQSVIGSMKQAEDSILTIHGSDSKEYQQFLQTKGQSLALAQSQLQAQYGQLKTTIATQMAQLKYDVKTKLQQLVSYDHQNYVNTLNSMAASDAQMSIHVSQAIFAKEQAKTLIGESFSNFLLTDVPTFAIDLMPMLMQVNQIAAEYQVNYPNKTIQRPYGGVSGPAYVGMETKYV